MERLGPSKIPAIYKITNFLLTCLFKPNSFIQEILRKRKLRWGALLSYVVYALSIEAIFIGFINIHLSTINLPIWLDKQMLDSLKEYNIGYSMIHIYSKILESRFSLIPFLQIIDWTSFFSGFVFFLLSILNPVLVYVWFSFLGKQGSLKHAIFIALSIQASIHLITTLFSYFFILIPSFLNFLFPNKFTSLKLSDFLFGSKKLLFFASPCGFLYLKNYCAPFYLIILYMKLYKINWFQSMLALGGAFFAYLLLLIPIIVMYGFLLFIGSLIGSILYFVKFFF